MTATDNTRNAKAKSTPMAIQLFLMNSLIYLAALKCCPYNVRVALLAEILIRPNDLGENKGRRRASTRFHNPVSI